MKLSMSLKSADIARLETGCGVDCPSICCEYVFLPLLNKEPALAYDSIEYS